MMRLLTRLLDWLSHDGQSAQWLEGNDAYYAGKSEDSNPYYGDDNRSEWLAGYRGQK